MAPHFLSLLLACLLVSSAVAQSPVHFPQSAYLPPGAVGSHQLLRGGPLRGYFQPVQIRVPDGAAVSLVIQQQFTDPAPHATTAGMLIGQVYRAKVTGIPGRPGEEVFPTIEVINRLHPPKGYEARFPIPIELTTEELLFALQGRFVTRVIYLENPSDAFPMQENPKRQRYFEVHQEDDPLQVADRLGRPMAILRMGSRQPNTRGPSDQFVFGSPPLLLFPDEYTQPAGPVTPQQQGRSVPRLPFDGPLAPQLATPREAVRR